MISLILWKGVGQYCPLSESTLVRVVVEEEDGSNALNLSNLVDDRNEQLHDHSLVPTVNPQDNHSHDYASESTILPSHDQK